MLTVVFDVETTGLTLHPKAELAKQPRIIEFGAVKLGDSGEEVDAFSILINPGMEIEPEITKITGLTNDDLRDAPKFPEAVETIRKAFAGTGLMVAHNLNFDESLLRFDLERAGVEDFPWPRNKLCTVTAYAEEWGRRPRLIELFEAKLGRKYAQTHRALDDVRALCEIVRKDELWNLFPS